MKVGIEILGFESLDSADLSKCGFDFQSCQIMTDNYSSMLLDVECPNLSLDKLIINDAFDARSKLGIITQGLDLESSDQCIRRNSEILFLKQVEWMLHCGVSAIGCHLPVGDCTNFSRVLNRIASKLGKTIVHFTVY